MPEPPHPESSGASRSNSLAATPRILVVEDQSAMRQLLSDYLGQRGFAVTCCESAVEALRVLAIETPGQSGQSFPFPGGAEAAETAARKPAAIVEFDAVLTDVKMPGMDGLEFCRRVKQDLPELPVIVMTAYGSMETSIAALRAGAFDFVTKPVELELLKASLARATENSSLRRYIRRLESSVADERFDGLVGNSEVMRRLKDQLQRVADSSVTVLLSGESGTGKEIVARSLHELSQRSDKPFVAVNCAALPDTLLESELFGHVKGAFTDAREDREGLFVQADGGTLFLDEIGEMPLEMQPKLLRAIEEKSVRPLGGTGATTFDVRLVTATNRDLEAEVEARRFREDLYYRINVLEIAIPPLRSRGMDVLLLANHFLQHFSRMAGKSISGFDESVAGKLLAYDWPGNVRELRNTMERAVVLAQHERITTEELPQRIVRFQSRQLVLAEADNQPLAPLDQVERQYIRYVLQQTAGNRTEAARILGLDRKTLYRKLKDEEASG
jgi:two-component system response regulator HydG